MSSFRLFKIAVVFLIICRPAFSRGQEITATDTRLIHNAKVVILSEWHLPDFLPAYKRKLIEKLYKDDGMTDLVLEIGKSAAYLINDYLETGDATILPGFTQGNQDYLKAFGKYILPSGKPIKIHGVDFERMEIVPALKRVMEKTGHTKNELFEYLNTLPDTILRLNKYDMMKAERSAIIQRCISLYKSDIHYYSSIYDDGYIVKEVCENPAVETEWNKRFDAMAHNLRLLYNKEAHTYLLIVGRFHIDCPNPIYMELENEFKMEENDIVNIDMVIKDCVTESMYQPQKKVNFAAGKPYYNEKGLIKSLFKLYSQRCLYQLVDVKTGFPNFKPGFKCDYILPVDCGFEGLKCD